MSSEQIEEMTRAPADLGKERCAIALRKALARSGRFATVRELAHASGIKYDTLKKYFQGRHLPSPETWKRLALALGQSRPTIQQAPAFAERGAAPQQPGASKQASRIWDTMKQLCQQLEFFKQGSREDRETLRKVVPGRDVGYATSLLRALYDEDEFQSWILFSEYSVKGPEDESAGDR